MNDKTPRELLQNFYKENNLPVDGGVNLSNVKIEFTKKIHIYFPNFDARRKAVVKHDIHHLLTGYETNVWGESEISAWEIGSGCKKYWAVFFIDTSGTMLGIPIKFRRVLKAFARGRKTKNLYHDSIPTEVAMDMKICELQSVLYLDKYHKNSNPGFIDFILFLTLILFGEIYSIISLLFLPLIIFYTIYIKLKITN